MAEVGKMWIMVSVVGRDRPGIVARVSKVLYEGGCNIEALTQTAIMGQFAMILIASFTGNGSERLNRNFAKLAEELSLEIHLRAIEPGELVPYRSEDTEPFVITVRGQDRPGLVYGISEVLAEYGVNITNLDAKVALVRERSEYLQVFMVDVPKRIDFTLLQEKLQKRGKEMGVSVDLQHRQIFQAINQI